MCLNKTLRKLLQKLISIIFQSDQKYNFRVHQNETLCEENRDLCNDQKTNSITIDNGTPTCNLTTGYGMPLLNSFEFPKEVLVNIVSKDKRSECTNCSSLQKIIFKSLLNFYELFQLNDVFIVVLYKPSKLICYSIYFIWIISK